MAAGVVVLYAVLPDYRNAIPEQRAKSSTVVADRNGKILRIVPDSKGRLSLWSPIERFPQCLVRAVVAAEDKRFFSHWGFDPQAMIRAVSSNIRNRKTVSGASTITQQVVRLITPRPRTISSKVIELFCAIKMEVQLTKEEILELYLNLSPMGGNLRGAPLGARVYFGKDVSRVSLAEAAVLAAIPRSPSRYDPRFSKGRTAVLQEKDRILTRMKELGWISPESFEAALGPVVPFQFQPVPFHAPHFVEGILSRLEGKTSPLRTTLDLDLQRDVERILQSHRDRLARLGIEQAAVLVVNRSGDILVMVGSLSYGPRAQGFNNGVRAFRSAGSTLKPFLYALALERGYNPSSELEDTYRRYPTPKGDYQPYNADRRFYGPVTVRSALGNSLNISAVRLARELGLEEFYQLLSHLKLLPPGSSSVEQYGLGLVLGNIEVNLESLVQAYTALAGGGAFQMLRALENDQRATLRVFSAPTAYLINDILSDPTARLLTFGNPLHFEFSCPIALKTGTSSNYRDCWAVGYTAEHVVGIWAGNFSGRPTNGVSGAAACGPILQDVIHQVYRGRQPLPFPRPDGICEASVCAMSGMLPHSHCPHHVKELFLCNRLASLPRCPMRHEDAHHYLGSEYAQWIDRREILQGKGRFRLLSPDRQVSPVEILPFHGLVSGNELIVKRRRSPIEIVSPHDSDRFVISPHRRDRVLFRAVPLSVVEHVTWLINGKETTKTPPPYEFYWEPIRGTHVIHAITPQRDSARITIHVE